MQKTRFNLQDVNDLIKHHYGSFTGKSITLNRLNLMQRKHFKKVHKMKTR